MQTENKKPLGFQADFEITQIMEKHDRAEISFAEMLEQISLVEIYYENLVREAQDRCNHTQTEAHAIGERKCLNSECGLIFGQF